MDSNRLVSIIIPIYNVEPYIERCVRSVLNQTYRNLEVILVDDCSPDRSMELAQACISQSLLSSDLNVVFMRHQHNRGLSAARNTGIEASTGEYLFFLDSDDELKNDAIELLCQEVDRNPGVEIVQGFVESVPHSNNYDIPFLEAPYYVDDNLWIRYHYYYLPKRAILINAWNKLVLRSFIVGHHLLFKEGIIYEDELWMYEVTKVLCKYSIVTNETYIHHFTEGSIMSSEDKTRRSFYMAIILNEVLNKLDEPLKELQLLFYSQFAKQTLNTKDVKAKKLLLRFALNHFKIQSYKIAFFIIIYSFFYPRGGRRLDQALSHQLSKYSSFDPTR